MSARFILHTIYLIFATLVTYLWTNSPTASSYTLQLVGILILLYFTAHFFTKKKNKKESLDRQTITLDLIILTSTILLIVTATGGLSSAFFFSLYFLLFAVALLLEIEATLVLTGVLLVFLSLLPNSDLSNTLHLTHLISLLMITPLAIFTAHQYEQKLMIQKNLFEAEAHLSQEETDTLMFLSTNLKTTLISALDKLTLIIPNTKAKDVGNDLTLLYQDLKNLYHSADELQQTIDQETDEK